MRQYNIEAKTRPMDTRYYAHILRKSSTVFVGMYAIISIAILVRFDKDWTMAEEQILCNEVSTKPYRGYRHHTCLRMKGHKGKHRDRITRYQWY